jgi:outer membrane lipoprotein-sorting protein
MKKSRIYVIPMIALGALLASMGSPALAEDTKLTADAILDTLTETMNPEQSQGEMSLTIVTSSGDERTFVYETYSKGQGEKSLMKYLKPSRVKGQTILMLNDADDIWTYFPRTKEIRKLATHAKKQKLEGSDFSYEDMGGGDAFIEEYDAVRLDDEKKEGRDCFTLELTRKEDSDASYSRVILWVDKENFVPLVIDYYHERDKELREKELVCSDVQLIDGIYTPMVCTMYNRLDDTYSRMEILEVTFRVDLPDDLFTEMGMQQ